MSSCTVGVVSDTHGHLDPRVADAISGCDYAVHAGDVGGAAVLDALRSRIGNVVAVVGNNDVEAKWPVAERAWLRQLPAVAQLELPGGVLVVIHGDRILPANHRHQRLRVLYPHARAIVYGHSHCLREDREAIPWILNPGAAGRSRTYGGPSCMILHASHKRWRVRQFRFALQSGRPIPRTHAGN